MSEENIEIKTDIEVVPETKVETQESLEVVSELNSVYDVISQINTALTDKENYTKDQLEILYNKLYVEIEANTGIKPSKVLSLESQIQEIEKASIEKFNTTTQDYENKIKEIEKNRAILEDKLNKINEGRMGKIYNEERVIDKKISDKREIWENMQPGKAKTEFFKANKSEILSVR